MAEMIPSLPQYFTSVTLTTFFTFQCNSSCFRKKGFDTLLYALICARQKLVEVFDETCPLKNGALKTELSSVISLCYNDSAFQLKQTRAHTHLPAAQLVQVDTTICLEVEWTPEV